MYKNQLQELAQRSCFNLPSYSCLREGPDHAPRFKATVNFNGETFESPHHCSTLRQAEHSAAEVALSSLSSRHFLAAGILDETGMYKNLLQEISQRLGAPLPRYTTFRSGLGHQPIFKGIVEIAGIAFTGDPAKNKKQAEKNAAMAAWSSLKQLEKEDTRSSENEHADEIEQITISRALFNYKSKQKLTKIPFPSSPNPFSSKPTSPNSHNHVPSSTSKILPLICPGSLHLKSKFYTNFGGACVARRPYVSCKGVAPPVVVRNAAPVFSAPPPYPTSFSVKQAPDGAKVYAVVGSSQNTHF